MAAITHARAFGAHAGGRYGSFEGRGQADHPVGPLTQPRAFGAHAGVRYGSFAGRGAAPRDVGPLTQARAFGAHSGTRYGSFAGRGGVSPPIPPDPPFSIGLPRSLVDAQRARRITTDELLMLIAAQLAAGLLH